MDHLMEVAYKRFCQDYGLHSMTDALLSIIGSHPFDPGEVAEIVVRCPEVSTRMIGTIRNPESVTAAHFSANFGLALQLVKGAAGIHEYSEANLWDPQVRELAKRIRLEPDEELSPMYPIKMPAHVTVKLKNGKTYEARVDSAKGAPENPLSNKELDDKFRNLSGTVLLKDRIEEIIDRVRNLDDVSDVGRLARLLVHCN